MHSTRDHNRNNIVMILCGDRCFTKHLIVLISLMCKGADHYVYIYEINSMGSVYLIKNLKGSINNLWHIV